MELTDYWRVVRRRWQLIAAFLLGAVILTGAVTWTATPVYESTARLFVATSQSESTTDAYQGGLFATQRIASYADLVESRSLAEEVAEELDGDVDASVLVESVSATVTPETVILEVTATSTSPEQAREIAQTYAETLPGLVADYERTGSGPAPVKLSVVDPAAAATSPVSPQPLRNLALAVVLGLLVGVGAAVLRELTDRSIRTDEDVERVTDSPLLGSIMLDQHAADGDHVEMLGSTTPWAEAFRVLRTNMQYVDIDRPQKAMVMTSSLPGEGKSTTVVNLAVTLAMAGQRVALVECDLRRPLIARRLGLDGAVGTTSVLLGKVDARAAMQQYRDLDLHVLACGPVPPNPSELLQSDAMHRLIDQLRREFDMVLLDAPPLLPVTDAALLAPQVDGAVVVVRHGQTTTDQLDHALDRLEQVEGRLLGVVLNMAPVSKRGGSGNYSYGYGYGYGYGDPKPAGPGADLVGRRRLTDAPSR